MFQILLWYPWKGKKEYVPLRTAYSQDSRYALQPKARQSSRAGAAKTRTETCELVEEKQKLLDMREKRTRESLVYADKPQTLDHLEDNIRRVIADRRRQMLEKVIENWTSRLDYIRASRGSPMPEIIFKM
ncbi:hypothetical protein TNCV_3322181 [Trichonephila clavipes]|nr:hypothetical protein TNCV_3322181 [Trichonephila clavipes]